MSAQQRVERRGVCVEHLGDCGKRHLELAKLPDRLRVSDLVERVEPISGLRIHVGRAK
ncbi:MAG: hypothetical protein ACKVUT_00295 [Gaiella sp.]